MTSLAELREQIDQIDSDLVEKLTRRAELVLAVKKAKQNENVDIYSPARERQILDRVAALAANGAFPQEPLERIFINIIGATRSLIGDLQVAYLGPESSLACEAAMQQFGESIDLLPAASIEAVISKVERGDCHFGVIPARTSSTGLVTQTFDVLMQSKLMIIAELEVKERLALFTASGGLGNLKRIYSDAHSFVRAENWIQGNVPEAELVLSRSLPEALRQYRKSDDSALLWLESLASRENLPVAASGIESDLGTDTRYIVVGSKIPQATGSDKTSLLCSAEERSGALRQILQPFSVRGITLLKIESRPMRGRAWEYVFFIDISGHQSDPKIMDAISDLEKLTSYLKVLGSYPMVCQS
jgi:chorismate mutase/prephenate dehydratase